MVPVIVIVVLAAGVLLVRQALRMSINERKSVDQYHHALEVLKHAPDENSHAGDSGGWDNNRGDSDHNTNGLSMPSARAEEQIPPAPPAITEPPSTIRIIGRTQSSTRPTDVMAEMEKQAEMARRRFMDHTGHGQHGIDQNEGIGTTGQAGYIEAHEMGKYSNRASEDAHYAASQPSTEGDKPPHGATQPAYRHRASMVFVDDTLQGGPSFQDTSDTVAGRADPGSANDVNDIAESKTTSNEVTRSAGKPPSPLLVRMRALDLKPSSKRIVAALALIIVALALALTTLSLAGKTSLRGSASARAATSAQAGPSSTSGNKTRPGTSTKLSGHGKTSSKSTQRHPIASSGSNTPNPYGSSGGSGPVQPVSYTTFTGSYPAPPGDYSVTLSPGERCWVMAKSQTSGNVLWTGMTYPGHPQVISANGPATIELGAAFNMSVTIAGKVLSFPAGYSSPFTMTLTPVS
ncbi:MAG: hypothetical protein ACYDGY_06700 [Acidimicrobiales bacterium]